MSVEVDLEGIRRAWEADGGEIGEIVIVAFKPASPVTKKTVAAVETAIDATNLLAETRWLDLDGESTVGRRPTQLPGAVALELESQHPDGPRDWLTAFAEALDVAGFRGKVVPHVMPRNGRFDTLGNGQPASCLMVVMAWEGHGEVSHNRAAVPVWDLDRRVAASSVVVAPPGGPSPAEAIPELVEAGIAFLGTTPGNIEAAVGTVASVKASDLAETLTHALQSEHASFVWVRKYGLHENRQVTYGPDARVSFALWTDQQRLLDQAEDMLASLVDVADQHAEWAALLENGIGHALPDSYEHSGRGARLDPYFEGFRYRDREYMPDAFVWQLLGAGHLARAHDLSRWQVEQIGNLTLVRKPALTDWLSANGENPGMVRLDRAELEAARADFGDMILRTP